MTNNIDSLRRYTKEELLFGIGYACTDTDVRIITSAIERKRMQDDLEKERRLLRESNDAFTAYSEIRRRQIAEFGKGAATRNRAGGGTRNDLANERKTMEANLRY